MKTTKGSGVQVLVRLILDDRPGSLSNATSAIARFGGNILAMDVVDRVGMTVVDDFVVQLDGVSAEQLSAGLADEAGVTVDCIRSTPLLEMHRELELISALASRPRPSLELLAHLVPAIVRCDWSVVISSAGSGVAITHASADGPRIRWTTLPWLPLDVATTLDSGDDWVPSSLHSATLTLAAAPINGDTCILAGRWLGPAFRPREVDRLAQVGRLAGRLLSTATATARGEGALP